MEAAAFLEETLCPVLVESTVGHEEGTLPWSDFLRICSEIQTLQLAEGGSTGNSNQISSAQLPADLDLRKTAASLQLFSTRWRRCISRQEGAETSSSIRPSPCADVEKATPSCLQTTESSALPKTEGLGVVTSDARILEPLKSNFKEQNTFYSTQLQAIRDFCPEPPELQGDILMNCSESGLCVLKSQSSQDRRADGHCKMESSCYRQSMELRRQPM
ncbi:hypothetical protein AOLI_G00191300 [Acnodon oligacanthus]